MDAANAGPPSSSNSKASAAKKGPTSRPATASTAVAKNIDKNRTLMRRHSEGSNGDSKDVMDADDPPLPRSLQTDFEQAAGGVPELFNIADGTKSDISDVDDEMETPMPEIAHDMSQLDRMEAMMMTIEERITKLENKPPPQVETLTSAKQPWQPRHIILGGWTNQDIIENDAADFIASLPDNTSNYMCKTYSPTSFGTIAKVLIQPGHLVETT